MMTNDVAMARQETTTASLELHNEELQPLSVLSTLEENGPVMLVDVRVVEVAVVEVAVNVDVLMEEAIPTETMSSIALAKLPPFLGLWDQREYANPCRTSTEARLVSSPPTAALRSKKTAIAVVFFHEATSAKPSSSRGVVAASAARMVQLPV